MLSKQEICDRIYIDVTLSAFCKSAQRFNLQDSPEGP